MRLFNKLPRICAAMIILGGILVSSASCDSKPATYSDVYGEGVKPVYELGLVDEKNTAFTSEGQLTNAEAVMLAARAHASLNETTVPSSGGEWYEAYYKYAENNGFPAESYGDPDAPVERGYLAAMLAKASEGKLTAVNTVESIPDVPSGKDYSAGIISLYNAGITLGQDSYGNFFPASPIDRTEAVELISRIFGGEKITGTLDVSGEQNGYSIIMNSAWNAVKEGLASGWQLDNRGGIPRKALLGDYGSLSDISDTAGTALIREFNKIDSGVINLTTKINIDAKDGSYLEFRNDAGASVWRAEVIGGAWQLVSGGVNTKLCDINGYAYDFRVAIDLNNCRATVFINGKDCGTAPLAVKPEAADLAEFRYGTTEKGKCMLTPVTVTLTANYPFNESFTYLIDDEPFGSWELYKAKVESGALKLTKKGTASTSFDPVSGKIISEFMVLYRKIDALNYSLRSGDRDIAVFKTTKEGFTVNDQLVYACDYGNLWYRIRLELDVETETMLVKVNGRYVNDSKPVPFANPTTSVDTIAIINEGSTAVTVDNLKVFREYEREDYVPQPVVPKDSNNNIVGMNVCSLWINGSHFGWSCVSPYKDPEPVLGYYDEGIPETADWEIKYIVEHGIDFQAFCIYMGQNHSEPQRPATEHLYDGFMNAKYSDLAKFCVIWECANAGSPASMDEWKNQYVPYFIENYFKDPRHITLDNRLVLCVFGSGKLAERIGGAKNVKPMFDYLEEEVKKLGFDGMVYLACGSSSDTLNLMGFDGCYAYNWGNAGSDLKVNTQSILSSARQGAVYTVPTISVGFNSIPWHSIRDPMMTAEDYAAAHEWVKTEYWPKYAKEAWQKNFVMLSTWNEYGEGTYIMPTADERGFAYLDVLREAYTDEKADPSINTVPTAAQKARINNLYPQDLHLLRLEGYYEETLNMKSLETIYTIDYSNASVYIGSTENQKIDENGISGRTTTTDPMIIHNSPEKINLDEVDFIRITAKLEQGAAMQMFFITESDKAWNETKGKVFAPSEGDTELTTYIMRADQLKAFTGTLAGFRVDPGSKSGANYTLKSVEFLKEKQGIGYSMLMEIDGNEFKQKFRPADNEAGELCIAFDPSIGLDFALASYHDWDRDSGILTLYFEDHTIVYTVGKDTYTLDGKEKSIGCKLTALDGLPMIPISRLCKDLGYTYKLEEGIVKIETKLASYYKEINTDRVYGQWEFNVEGRNDGWSSTSMQCITSNGYMSCDSLTTGRDPIISYNETIALDTNRYKTLEIRVRYKHDGGSQNAVIYFGTDLDSALDEAKTIKAPLKGTNSGEEWETIRVDLTKISTWKGTCNKLRFDPFNAVGHMDVDYIRFLEG